MEEFTKGTIYLFNIVVNGQLWPIECMFTGDGELRGNEEFGYFVRVQDNQETTKFCWNLETARANLPVSWGEEKEVWG